ncbi:hypothetical protein EYF80_018712 [Liparis tanakae]|uniref:Uncharacterized protein n=1 Tax=Liparis tanakae TaxID=230148 RepID=A0A4Z2HZQ4_9TELE|nr:hypothetical protein EYF80_018712 [Liparis tanakae]
MDNMAEVKGWRLISANLLAGAARGPGEKLGDTDRRAEGHRRRLTPRLIYSLTLGRVSGDTYC